MENLYHPIILPGLKIEGNIFLAPVAGYTDISFRSICRDYGADLTFTEMVSSDALCFNNKKTLPLMEKAPNEDCFGIQLFTSDYKKAAESIPLVLKYKPSIIDFNCGCPVPKILRSNAGSALLKTPEKIGDIIKAVKDKTDIPISIKIRLGWDKDSINYLRTAEIAERAGAVMITLHPRTRAQVFTGQADWAAIKKLKENSPLIITGSGDLFTPSDAEKMLSETSCDAVMFARGAFGKPYIFSQTKALLLNEGEIKEPDGIEKLNIAEKQLELCIKYRGEKTGVQEMKKHIMAYTKGIPNSSEFRQKIVTCKTLAPMKEAFNDFRKEIAAADLY